MPTKAKRILKIHINNTKKTKMKTMKALLPGERIEIPLPAFFHNSNSEIYIKIDENEKNHIISLGNKNANYQFDPLSNDYITTNYDILDPSEGLGIWESAVMELKERINEL